MQLHSVNSLFVPSDAYSLAELLPSHRHQICLQMYSAVTKVKKQHVRQNKFPTAADATKLTDLN